MNQTFSLKRFGLLFKKHTIENYKGYLMSLIVLISLLAISFGSALYKSQVPLSTSAQAINYVIFLLMGGCIFTSTVFTNLSDKRKTIATLTLPASSLEKFMVGWIYSYLVFQLLFTGIFFGLVLLINSLISWPANTEVQYLRIFNDLDKVYLVYIAYIILHAIIIYGAIYFQKMHFIKTAFVFFLGGGLIWLVNDSILQKMIGHPISGNPPFGGASFRDTDDYYNLDMGDTSRNLTVALFLVLAIIVWVAAYFRLKEKQV